MPRPHDVNRARSESNVHAEVHDSQPGSYFAMQYARARECTTRELLVTDLSKADSNEDVVLWRTFRPAMAGHRSKRD